MGHAARVSQAAALLSLIACADATRAVAPDDRADVRSGSTPLVTGSGHFTWPDGGDVGSDGGWRTFTLNVMERPDGTVRGHFQLVNRELVSQLKGNVICAGRDAARPSAIYVALRITESTNAAQVNTVGVVWVQDNGSGATATGPDRLTAVITGVPAFAEAVGPQWCAGLYPNRLGQPAYDVESGNITVR